MNHAFTSQRSNMGKEYREPFVIHCKVTELNKVSATLPEIKSGFPIPASTQVPYVLQKFLL